MGKTFRIYGKTLNTWRIFDERLNREVITQYEIAYTEYDAETFRVISTGSEDFSLERFKSEIANKSAYTWDGSRINKGGKRWFDYIGSVRYRRSDAKIVREFIAQKYSAALAELR